MFGVGSLLISFLLISCGWMDKTVVPESAPVIHTKELFSDAYGIDAKYKSMRGPAGIKSVNLLDGPPELLWIVGYETLVVEAEKSTPMSQEFMCHANLDFDAAAYYEMFSSSVPLSGRVFTLSQGQQTINFPPGFGIPVGSHLPLQLATQVLNLNLDAPDLEVRHQVKIHFVRDAELSAPMQPLFQGAVEGFKSLEEAKYYGVPEGEVNPALHGQGCSVGFSAIEGSTDDDALGQRFTAHWVVEPGREVNTTNVTRFLNLPFDTEAHYIAVHLHPFAESLTLRDLTLDKDIFFAEVENSADKIGIDRVDYYSSKEGIKLYKDHEYELVSVYENTSGEEVDSMAVMYLYLHDKWFKKPEFALKL
jgi:hypothetical protein